jgi:hypothetical protein
MEEPSIVLYVCELWSLTLGKHRNLKVLDRSVLRKVIESKRKN